MCFRFPWVCSLKEAGFSGRHKCGVTLLSGGVSWFLWTYSYTAEKLFYLFFVGPESREVVLVSAAHCNFVCKVLFIWKDLWGMFWRKNLCRTWTTQTHWRCCCRKEYIDSSCRNVRCHFLWLFYTPVWCALVWAAYFVCKCCYLSVFWSVGAMLLLIGCYVELQDQ